MSLPRAVPLEEFHLPRGFDATGVACGLKPSGKLDVALIVADRPCTAAGVFTTNRVVAAPVVWDRARLAERAGDLRAIVANSGCANACTGERGWSDTEATAAHTARALGLVPGQVLVLSTGVIGVPLDLVKLTAGIDDAARGIGDAVTGEPVRRPDGPGPATATARETRHAAAVRAIMTTDTQPKTAAADLLVEGRPVAIRGFAKGAGMIHPGMATMLAVLTTDAALPAPRLDALLRAACDRSFNRLSVDGDMSTNDTVLFLASGASGARLGPADEPAFQAALLDVCVSLARQIACDGEGATRLVEITVSGAAREGDAHRVADAIARSPLFKTAVHGGDPNWGRVLAAAGASGVDFDARRATLEFGAGAAAVRVVEQGIRARYDEADAAARLRQNPVIVRLDLGAGAAEATVWTCDLSAAYVSINADYTT
jgi:glutamate N-acetyltransferase/amino-acid N-acetyltransferase